MSTNHKMFDISLLKTKHERIDQKGVRITNESNKLPGHQERMEAHCERVQREYFDSGLHNKDRWNIE